MAREQDWFVKLSLRLDLPEASVRTSSQFLPKLFLSLNGKKDQTLECSGGKI